MSKVPTPHIAAKEGEFADTVLMPGDPLRAKRIADTYLEGAAKISDIRGNGAYTGFYRGKRVSVMASGMGMPSMGIYSYELFHFYNVKNIIRVGTAGALQEGLELRDVVLASAACTDSAYAAQFGVSGTLAPVASFDLLKRAAETAKREGLAVSVGSVLSSDRFYDETDALKQWSKMGVLCVEMEAAALYLNAMRAGKNALCICTISDQPFTGKQCSAQERQDSFHDMIRLALELA